MYYSRNFPRIGYPTEEYRGRALEAENPPPPLRETWESCEFSDERKRTNFALDRFKREVCNKLILSPRGAGLLELNNSRDSSRYLEIERSRSLLYLPWAVSILIEISVERHRDNFPIKIWKQGQSERLKKTLWFVRKKRVFEFAAIFASSCWQLWKENSLTAESLI